MKRVVKNSQFCFIFHLISRRHVTCMGRDRFSRDRFIQSEEWAEIKSSVIGLPFAPGYVPKVFLLVKSKYQKFYSLVTLNSIKSIDN